MTVIRPNVPFSNVILPDLPFEGTPNESARVPESRKPTLIVVHAWGNAPARTPAEAQSRFAGNVAFMRNPSSEVSAHVVYGGTLGYAKGHAVQLVEWHRKAWTEAALNSAGLSIESADAIWHGLDPAGMRQLARIVAFMCHKTNIPPRWTRAMSVPGFCRHLDTGALGNPNHHACPTAERAPWDTFVRMVSAEAKRGGFRESWGSGHWRRI